MRFTNARVGRPHGKSLGCSSRSRSLMPRNPPAPVIVVAASIASARIQHRPWIDSSLNRIVNSIVKMRLGVAGIACISNVSDDVAGIDYISGFEAAISIEVRVVVALSSRAEHVDDLSPEGVGAYANDNAFCCAQNWSTAVGEDVYASMWSPSASGGSP